ncbi:hypothetical protein VTI74DRAFT_4094 [Chaetomium olivicolor]
MPHYGNRSLILRLFAVCVELAGSTDPEHIDTLLRYEVWPILREIAKMQYRVPRIWELLEDDVNDSDNEDEDLDRWLDENLRRHGMGR